MLFVICCLQEQLHRERRAKPWSFDELAPGRLIQRCNWYPKTKYSVWWLVSRVQQYSDASRLLWCLRGHFVFVKWSHILGCDHELWSSWDESKTWRWRIFVCAVCWRTHPMCVVWQLWLRLSHKTYGKYIFETRGSYQSSSCSVLYGLVTSCVGDPVDASSCVWIPVEDSSARVAFTLFRSSRELWQHEHGRE